MNTAALRAYARLILKTGVNLQPGQKLDIGWEPAHRDLVDALTEEAYTLGAAFVNPRLNVTSFTRHRALHSAAEHLDFVPGWMTAYWEELVRDDWAVVALTGAEDPFALDGADPARLGRMLAALGSRRSGYREAMMKSAFCWNVAAAPTDGWARQVLGGQARADDLWKVLVPILGLDEPDPAASWQKRLQTLEHRRRTLDALKVDRLRFTGPGTDLTVGLMTASRWCGGFETAGNGRVFAPNLPTEEVFTTPDWRRTEGTAACTRPVEVLETEVSGARFTFREGRVVDFGADTHRDILERYLGQDGQANALGEVALVDASSRIFQSGRVFHNILFDENAACHIALGGGYPDAVATGRSLGPDALLALGCNVSQVHTDFMIGGPEVSVDAVTADGRTVRVIDRGTFVQL